MALIALKEGFRHGIHPDGHKEETVDLQIQRLPFGSHYVLPLGQHVGVPSQPTVTVGERVYRGQLIATAPAFVSVALHSPVTGWVRAIAPRHLHDGRLVAAIEIEADPFDSQRMPQAHPIDWTTLSTDEFVEHVQNAGIVGMGGATFPAHVKYSVPHGLPVESLLINGAECEPYLTVDHRLMVERPQALINGIEILRHHMNAPRAIIGVELNKADAIAILRKTIRPDQPIDVIELRVKYPQGAEKLLINTVYKRELPQGKIPRDFGISVNNVGTVVALADYFASGTPLMERVITVSGPGINKPANLIVPLGTPIRDILNFCGGLRPEARQLLMGGPMMGMPINSIDTPILKSSSGVLAFTEKEMVVRKEYACIQCGRCVQACPCFLNPSRLARLAKARLFAEMQNYSVNECFECGSCAYSCPSAIPIVQLIRSGRNAFRKPKGPAK